MPVSPGQKVGIAVFIVVLTALATVYPDHVVIALVGVASVAYSGHLLFRATVWVAGWPPAANFPQLRTDDELPVYTIIVPLYREASMMTGIVAALSRLDYPRNRLETFLAIECDDSETLAALAAADLPYWIRPVIVPPGTPRTKPRACNHALSFATGSFTVVFDAEDRPEPNQLREAIAAFDAYGPDIVCLQARLIPFNVHDSVMSRMFALDYCQWFDSTLTGMQRLGLPIPLGGTSNHFRTAALVESGAWDSYNVTEDADLGIRLARLGLGVRTIQSTTFEEAPVSIAAWLPQRSRWIKGYIQTFLVHARSPSVIGLPALDVAGLVCLGFFVGGSVLFALINPIFWGMMIYGWTVDRSALDWVFQGVTGPMALASMFAGNSLGVLIAALSPVKRGWWRLVPWALAVPLYWILLSIAAYRAVYSFIVAPFHWAKTTHGITRTVAGA